MPDCAAEACASVAYALNHSDTECCLLASLPAKAHSKPSDGVDWPRKAQWAYHVLYRYVYIVEGRLTIADTRCRRQAKDCAAAENELPSACEALGAGGEVD